jgi:hypothetical protein
MFLLQNWEVSIYIFRGPLHHERLRREDIQPVVDKIMKKIAGWKGRLLSYGARLTLLKACLASIFPSTSCLSLSFLSGPLRLLISRWLNSFGMIVRINIGFTCPTSIHCASRKSIGVWAFLNLGI